jgi:hypothetical protein
MTQYRDELAQAFSGDRIYGATKLRAVVTDTIGRQFNSPWIGLPLDASLKVRQ